ncbi:hypothetical protein CEV34_3224 [Brucella pseudogrignonensis]|uniref:Uncharacterized protein n=1 Tax=Brucella pseudogrignonensis TaxID=419475 RepID=A0A256GB99_9HYPH|nr:hypothetical protein CEV34_3224 [Brucella pseudogrignonensis]
MIFAPSDQVEPDLKPRILLCCERLRPLPACGRAGAAAVRAGTIQG